MIQSDIMRYYGQSIHDSPSPFHAVEASRIQLVKAGFIELKEEEAWHLNLSQGYFTTREDSSIIAFHTPTTTHSKKKFRIIGSHTDSPCIKLKSNPTKSSFDYSQLNVEVYGGVLLNSWLDRDLKLSGLIIGQTGGELTQKLVSLPWIFRIPQLAIHLDRDIRSKGLQINAQKHMVPIAGLETMNEIKWKDLLQSESGLDDVLSWDLCFHDTQRPTLAGLNEEFFIAPRLDNLAMLFTSLKSIIQVGSNTTTIPIVASFNHEEVGSASHEGAGGSFLENVLERISISLNWERTDFLESLPQSLFMSADMAHAVHPNYSNKHDPEHQPKMNQGPVLKTNVNQKYATSASSAAQIRLISQKANIPLQDFHSRNDMGCGSTIGPSSCARLGIPGLDIGNAMLSMHSIRELCGSHDFKYMEMLMEKFLV